MGPECQQTRDLLDAYLGDELLVETAHQLHRHLNYCAACRDELDRRRRTALLFRELGTERAPATLRARIIEALEQASVSTSREASGTRRAWWPQRWVKHLRAMLEDVIGSVHIRRAVLALLVGVLVLWIVWAPREHTISAAELLTRAEAVDAALYRDAAVTRTFDVEEWDVAGRLIGRHRVEVARQGALVARRLRDRSGRVTGGAWSTGDGHSQIYRLGASGPLPPVTREDRPSLRSLVEVPWHIDASPSAFVALVRLDLTRVTESTGSYLVEYRAPWLTSAVAAHPVVERATLTLDRPSLRVIRQTVTVREGDVVRELRYLERAFSRVGPDDLPQATFEPDAGLMPAPRAALEATRPRVPVRAVADEGEGLGREVEVLRRLDAVGALFGEQISVERSPDGRVTVDGVVDDAARKAQLQSALSSLAADGRVRIRIETGAERVQQRSDPSPNETTFRQVEVETNRFAAADLVQRHLQTEKDMVAWPEIQRFADGLLTGSRQALVRSWALERLTTRFPPERLRSLNPDAHATWLTLVVGHARAIQYEASILRLTVGPLVAAPHGAGDASAWEEAESQTPEEFAGALVGAASATDEAIREAFAASAIPVTPADLQIAREEFWTNLRRLEVLAARVAGR